MVDYNLWIDVFILILNIIVLLFLLFPLRFPLSERINNTDILMVIVFLSATSAIESIDFSNLVLLNSVRLITNIATIALILAYMAKRRQRLPH